MLTRRTFLGSAAGLSSLALGGAMPRLFAQAAEQSALAGRNDHVLVVVELAGGNDGLNTVIPFEDPLYYKNRRTLAIPKPEVIRLNDRVGFHPKMAALGNLFKEGRVAVVQGVGYPEPDRSHFRSMEIWHTASISKRPPTSGWLGQYLDSTRRPGQDSDLRGVALGNSLPQAFKAEESMVPVVAELERFSQGEGEKSAESTLLRKLSTAEDRAASAVSFLRRQAAETYRTADRLKQATANYKAGAAYPEGPLAAQLQRAAQILTGHLGVRVLFVSQDGYDTHANQADGHASLLEQLSMALAAFDADLRAQGLAEKVVVMTFSEFGRRVDENGSRGTDHGAASCLFLTGAKVKGGLTGQYPALDRLGEGDLVFTTDFRSIYATVLERWLGCPSSATLGGKFATHDLIQVT